jgi:hypothetical protein
MNKLVVAALAACLATTVSAKQPEMVVTANPSFTSWVQNASRSLDYAMMRVDLARSESGVTYVRFNCDPNGKPQNITTMSSAVRHPVLDRVGRQVIKRVRTLHPMFDGARPGQLVEAAIIVADDQAQLDRLRAAVTERAVTQNNRWAERGEATPVVLLAVAGR